MLVGEFIQPVHMNRLHAIINNMNQLQRGYSVVEVIVALTLFITVVAISSSTTLSILDGNRSLIQSQDLFTNVEVAVDDLIRNLRSGDTYYCYHNMSGNLNSPRDCAGQSVLAFESQNGVSGNSNDQIVYGLIGDKLYKSEDGGVTRVSVFQDDIVVQEFKVWVEGSSGGDLVQPRAKILLIAEIADTTKNISSTARYQASVVQRILDSDG